MRGAIVGKLAAAPLGRDRDRPGAARLRAGARQGRRSATTAPPATARAAAAPRAIRTCATTTGSGAARWRTIQQTIRARRPLRPTPRAAHGRDAGLRHATACSSATRSRPSRTMCARSSGQAVEPTAEPADGQARSSPTTAPPATATPARATAELGAPNLTDAIWLYGGDQATIDRDHHERPRRRDAGLGRPARPDDHQGAGRLRPLASAAANRPGRQSAAGTTARGAGGPKHAPDPALRIGSALRGSRLPDQRRQTGVAEVRPVAGEIPRRPALDMASDDDAPLRGAQESIPQRVNGTFRTHQMGDAGRHARRSTTSCPSCAGIAGRTRPTRRCWSISPTALLLLLHRDLAAGGLLHHRPADHRRAGAVPDERRRGPASGAAISARRRSGPTCSTPVERWIEGDRRERMRKDKPRRWTCERIARKVAQALPLAA